MARKRKTMRVGETKVVMRKITRQKGGVKKRRAGTGRKVSENRKCYVTKLRKGKYSVRLVNPKKNTAGRKYNIGRGHNRDQRVLNRREKHERDYKKLFGRRRN